MKNRIYRLCFSVSGETSPRLLETSFVDEIEVSPETLYANCKTVCNSKTYPRHSEDSARLLLFSCSEGKDSVSHCCGMESGATNLKLDILFR